MISSIVNPDVQHNATAFQSRNRGSFDFKPFYFEATMALHMLFQSRNRGSFDFKPATTPSPLRLSLSFNLVIEVLLISSYKDIYFPPSDIISFNLVIEVLLISSLAQRFQLFVSYIVSIS